MDGDESEVDSDEASKSPMNGNENKTFEDHDKINLKDLMQGYVEMQLDKVDDKMKQAYMQCLQMNTNTNQFSEEIKACLQKSLNINVIEIKDNDRPFEYQKLQ